jgi:hypothetical protein
MQFRRGTSDEPVEGLTGAPRDALRERWAASSPVVGTGVAVPHLSLAGAPVEPW